MTVPTVLRSSGKRLSPDHPVIDGILQHTRPCRRGGAEPLPSSPVTKTSCTSPTTHGTAGCTVSSSCRAAARSVGTGAAQQPRSASQITAPSCQESRRVQFNSGRNSRLPGRTTYARLSRRQLTAPVSEPRLQQLPLSHVAGGVTWCSGPSGYLREIVRRERSRLGDFLLPGSSGERPTLLVAEIGDHFPHGSTI